MHTVVEPFGPALNNMGSVHTMLQLFLTSNAQDK